MNSKAIDLRGRPMCTGYSRQASVQAARMMAFVAFAAIGAQVSVRIPITPVPVTLQTLFVALSGIILGPRDGLIAMLLYVGFGLAGAPVFAGLSSGIWTVLGPTGGYIMSFPAGALVSGVIAESLDRRGLAFFIAALGGSCVILLIGASYLALLSGIDAKSAVILGVQPFILGEVLKALVASAVALRDRSRG